MTRFAFSLLALLVALVVVGCQINPRRADRFLEKDADFPEGSIGNTALLYVPNRFLDLLDVVHLGYGVGPGFGLEVQATRTLRLGAVFGVDAGMAWLGRYTDPAQVADYARASFSEFQAPREELPPEYGVPEPGNPDRPDVPPPSYDPERSKRIIFSSEQEPGDRTRPRVNGGQQPDRQRQRVWRFPRWDIGVHYHALLDHIYGGIAIDELVDFLVGWSTFDLKLDDF
jgi:hypothetical protein